MLQNCNNFLHSLIIITNINFYSKMVILLNMKWNFNSNICNKLLHDFILNYTVSLCLCKIIDGHFVVLCKVCLQQALTRCQHFFSGLISSQWLTNVLYLLSLYHKTKAIQEEKNEVIQSMFLLMMNCPLSCTLCCFPQNLLPDIIGEDSLITFSPN